LPAKLSTETASRKAITSAYRLLRPQAMRRVAAAFADGRMR
jgi:hypothetical protein